MWWVIAPVAAGPVIRSTCESGLMLNAVLERPPQLKLAFAGEAPTVFWVTTIGAATVPAPSQLIPNFPPIGVAAHRSADTKSKAAPSRGSKSARRPAQVPT